MTNALAACAHVADVGRSVEYYRHLGHEIKSTYESEEKLVWALVTRTGDASPVNPSPRRSG